LFWTLAALAGVVAWDAGGRDLAWAQAFGSSAGFPMRDHWFFVQVLHEDARRLGWLLVLLLALSVWWPKGILRRIDARERLQMAVSALLALALISIVKNLSATSCPWDLAQFGGVARHAVFPQATRPRVLHSWAATSRCATRHPRPRAGGWRVRCWRGSCWARRSRCAAPIS
jgi:membrane-associated PAP2 superfamily phosphatase